MIYYIAYWILSCILRMERMLVHYIYVKIEVIYNKTELSKDEKPQNIFILSV